MLTKLDVFDFDGTLFHSPADTPENKAKYERATGIPWVIDKQASRDLSARLGRHVPMRRGWWGKAETLEPPLVPDPAPKEWFIKDSVEALLKSKAHPDTMTLIMTGRHVGLKERVYRILHDGQLARIEKSSSPKGDFYRWADSDCIIKFLGDRGPVHDDNKPSETFPWKVWILEQYVDLYPSIKTVEIWEDRSEHVEKFRELDGALAETVIVNHVT